MPFWVPLVLVFVGFAAALGGLKLRDEAFWMELGRDPREFRQTVYDLGSSLLIVVGFMAMITAIALMWRFSPAL